jgi:KUP system potassium uptake protein
MATVIASQALISGIFSLTHQAVQLGLFPRVTIRHTSHAAEGQIYIPEVNWGLALACITLVISFRESTRLAAAYGVAVTGAMTITSIAFYNVARRTWSWPRWKALGLLVVFLSFELPLFGANIVKFFDGGYIPIVVGAIFFYTMITWKRGRSLIGKAFADMAITVDELLARVERDRPARVKGACVFMASASHVPPILVHHLRHNQVLHETVILLTVSFEHEPRVDDERRVESTHLGSGIHRLLVRYGYMEEPDIPAALRLAAGRLDIAFDPEQVTYYLGRETLLATNRGFMKRGQEIFFAFLSRNALGATAYFRIPPDRVVELGLQLDL